MTVNRIFCIGKNYAAHVDELAHLGFAADGECVVFMKPASSVVPAGQDIQLPRQHGEVHHEAELVVRLGRFDDDGREVPVERALRHVTHVTLGLDLTLRELQTRLKNQGAPWELAKAFDGSAPLGDWIDHDGRDLQALSFTLHVNGMLRQQGQTANMLYPVARQIHILSQSWGLMDGDIIYTGTPAGIGPLRAGDTATLEGPGLGRHHWRCI